MNIIESNLSWNGQLTLGNVPKMIVVHHAEASSCTVEDINRWHKERGWVGIGYHYFVRKDGSIYKGRPDNAIGAHCLNYNTNTLGVCFEGSYMKETMAEVQKQAGIELIKYLIQKYGISRIEPHRGLNATSCPGDNFPYNSIKDAALNSSIPTPVTSYQPIQNRTWLQVGDEGEKVKDLQSKLIKLGYDLGTSGADGEYGKLTKNAVYKFQHNNGLQEDGLAGNQTINCLNSKVAEVNCNPVIRSFQHACNLAGITDENNNKLVEDGDKGTHTNKAMQKVPLLQKGSKGEIVRWVQKRLIELGFSCGKAGADADFGVNTQIAVQNFQASRGLKADAKVGPLTLAELLK